MSHLRTRAPVHEDEQTWLPPRYDARAQDNGIDLKDLLTVLYRRRTLILVVVFLVTTLSGLTALALTPRYTAVAAVLIEPRKSRIIDTQAVVEEEPVDSSALAAEINLLKSRTYAQRVVEELDLVTDPKFNPAVGGAEGPLSTLAQRLESVVPDSWFGVATADENLERTDEAESPSPDDAAAASAETERAPPPTVPASEWAEHLMERAVYTLLGGLTIRAGGEYLIVIEFTSTDPNVAAQVANKVAELYVRDQFEIKQEVVARAADWLKERVAGLRARVLGSEEAIEAYRVEHGLINGGSGQDSGPVRDLAAARAERIEKEELLRWVRDLRGRGSDLEGFAAVLSLPALTELRAIRADLRHEEDMLRMKYAEQHPQIVQLNSGRHRINLERQRLARRIDEEIRTAIRNLEGEVAFARHRERELEAQLGESSAEAGPDGSAEVQLRDLQRKAEADRSLYITLLNRFNEVSEQGDLLEPGAKVASRAGVPVAPEFPRPKLMTAAGFTVSLILSALLAFLIEYFDSGLRTARQVERVLGVANLGFVPRVGGVRRRQKLHQYLLQKPLAAYAEAIRVVHMATADAVGEAGQPPPQAVLVTSSLPGEGKTTLALSLAASAAYSGRRAVVVDLDLRRPRLHREADLRLPLTGGVVECLAGDQALDRVLHTVGVGNARFDVLPVKRLPPSPPDLLRSPKMASLLTELRTRYEYIVLDSPPALGIIDARMAARLADAVLFAVRWEKTKEDVAVTGLQDLLDAYCPPVGAVLTQVNVRRHAKRGYGGAGQYYSKYSTYYAD